MGLCASRRTKESKPAKFRKIPDTFDTLQEVQNALRRGGLEACQLIVGIDFTKSNTWTGRYSFEGKSLHDLTKPPNFYERVLSILSKTLEGFDDDHLIPCYGFGDVTTQATSVFSFNPQNIPSKGLYSLVERYRQLATMVDLSGPTSFGPLIRQAMKIVSESGMKFHLLLIIADGQVSPNCMKDTANAIIQACDFPLSIVMIGVGDGPWDSMKEFDDALRQRSWDNFQLVLFERLWRNPNLTSQERREASFALNALMELPQQYKICQHMIGNTAQGSTVASQAVGHLSVVRDPPDILKTAGIFSSGSSTPQSVLNDYAKLF